MNHQTPPGFLVHGTEDHLVPVGNSIQFFMAVKAAKISASILPYPHAEHGFPEVLANHTWLNYCFDCLKDFEYLKRAN